MQGMKDGLLLTLAVLVPVVTWVSGVAIQNAHKRISALEAQLSAQREWERQQAATWRWAK